MIFYYAVFFLYLFLSSSASAKNAEQLIPGSILINDQGEIDQLPWKKNGQLKPSTSNNSFTPGTNYVADENGGPGGYLAPTHIQRRIVTSSPGLSSNPETQFGYKRSGSSSDASVQNRPTFNRQQTFPETTNNNIQPWVNPYWSKPNQMNFQSVENDKNNEKQNSLPLNSSTPTSSINTPLSTKIPENLIPSNGIKEPNVTITPTKENQQWNNIPSKDKNKSEDTTAADRLDESFSFEYKDMPVPSFYERIYPPPEPVSSPAIAPKKETEVEKLNKIPKQIVYVDEDTAYTIDSNGIAHYRPEALVPNNENQPTNMPYSSAAIPQHPSEFSDSHNGVPHTTAANTVPPVQTNQFIPPSNSNNTKSSQFGNINMEQLSLLNSSSSLNPTTATILTEDDLDNIQRALHLLATNPSALPVIETLREAPSSNVPRANKPVSTLNPLVASNKENKSQIPRPSSLTSSFPYNPQQQNQPSQLPPSAAPTSFSAFQRNISYDDVPYPHMSPSQQPQSSQPAPPLSTGLSAFSQNISYNDHPYPRMPPSQQPQPSQPAPAPSPPLSTAFSQNMPYNDLPYPYMSNSPQPQLSRPPPMSPPSPPTISPFGGSMGADISSYTYDTNSTQSRYPLSSIVFEEDIPNIMPTYSNGSSSSQPTFMSLPSYSVDSNNPLSRLTTKGSIALI